MLRTSKGNIRGFSLLEVLVAFAILAVSMTVLMQVFATSLRASSHSEDMVRAGMLAQSLLAEVGVSRPLTIGKYTGNFNEKYRWRYRVQPDIQGVFDRSAWEDLLLRPYRVDLTVMWKVGMRGRELSLKTVRVTSP